MSEIIREMNKTVRLARCGALYLILCGILFNVQPCCAAGAASKAVSTVVKGVIARTAAKQIKKALQSDPVGDECSNAGDEGVRKKRIVNLLRQRLKGKKYVDVVGESESATAQLGRSAECKNDSSDGKGAGCVVTVIISVLIVLGLSCLILWLIIASCSDGGANSCSGAQKGEASKT